MFVNLSVINRDKSISTGQNKAIVFLLALNIESDMRKHCVHENEIIIKL